MIELLRAKLDHAETAVTSLSQTHADSSTAAAALASLNPLEDIRVVREIQRINESHQKSGIAVREEIRNLHKAIQTLSRERDTLVLQLDDAKKAASQPAGISNSRKKALLAQQAATTGPLAPQGTAPLEPLPDITVPESTRPLRVSETFREIYIDFSLFSHCLGPSCLRVILDQASGKTLLQKHIYLSILLLP